MKPFIVCNLFYFLTLSSNLLYAQSASDAIDSLRSALDQFEEKDTAYVMTLVRLSNELFQKNTTQATAYAEEAVVLAQQLPDKALLAQALKIRGTCYLTEDRFAEALRSYIDAIPLFEEVKNSMSLANCYNNASLAYKHLNDFVQSLAYLTEAEHIFDSIGYQIGIARANNNLGSLLRLQNEPAQAERHYLKAFHTHIAMHNESGKSIAQLNLGLLYNEMKEYDKSRMFLDSALAYFTLNNLATQRVTTLIGLGELTLEELDKNENRYRRFDAYTQAEEYFVTAFAEADRLHMPKSKSSLLRDLARVKADQGNVEQSKQFALQARALADSLNTPQDKSRAEETLSYVFQKAGQWEQALTHYQQYKSWEDSIYNENKAALYKSQQVQMEVAQKDREIEAQSLQLTSLNERITLENRWKWTLGAASLLLLLAGVLYYQKYRTRKTYSHQLEAQNRLITDQKEEIEVINQRLGEQMTLRQETDDTINYFAASLYGKNTVDEILWDMAKNCIARLGLVDCVIYLIDESRGVLVQKAAYGTKNPKDFDIKAPLEIPIGQGIVGSVVLTGQPDLVNDTSQDARYIVDEEERLSELAVPIKHQDKVIGVLDSEHPEKNFYTQYHQDALKTIVAICASKIAQAQADEETRKAEIARREAEQIKAMDLMKSRFFANISHEFRTPLHLILGPLRTHAEQQIPQHELGMMQRNAHRLLRLVNQLMDLSKLEVGQLQLEYQQADIFAFLKNIAFSFSSLADDKRLTYQLDIPPRPYLARFDPDKLEKIVYNLLSNAIKFTPPQGMVSFHAAMEPPCQLRISVSDTGLGIPDELQNKVFDRFYQVDGSNTRAFEGTGIGLALIKELVDLYQGTIAIDSAAGQGATFVAVLPLQPAEGELLEEVVLPLEYEAPITATEEADADTEEGLSDERPWLLVVEDNSDLRHYIRTNLGDRYSYREAVHGKEGWDLALEHVPDIIITDVMMPEMDGIELTRLLKEDERTSHIPILMLTARDDVSTRRAGFQTGADQYLTKPFDVAELQDRLQGLLRQRNRLREKYGREVTLRPQDVTVNDHDAAFLERCLRTVEEHLGEAEFSVDQLQREIGMSRMQLHRKLKALTNQSATEFIRGIRLQRAAQLLQQNDVQVAEVAYDVGFNHLSYFAKCFKEKFGVAPSDYAKESTKST
ncbi:MAG: response regulator [Cyclobacteriaceae bacterium]